jgi:hypothetical protein
MAWAPQKQVIDLSQIADNLLGYIEANQVEVLDWAGDNLNPFAKFYTNASGRLQTIFPSLMILSQTCETDISGDILVAGLELTLEATIGGPNADELVANTKLYAKSVESMLANIPSATLTANSDPIMTAALFEIETRLDILRGQQSPTAFLQIFQTRCVFRLTASAF